MRWWQKILSYLIEVPIATTDSPHHDYLQVNLINGRYQLSTEHSIYSFDDLYLNFYKAFSKVALPPDQSDCLVLGLGLGSIPWMLERAFKQKYHYVMVDIDEEIIRLATSYRLSQLLSSAEVVCSDAVRFLEIDQRKYDLICVDVFLDDKVPESLCTVETIESLKLKLKQGGMLLWNRLYRTKQDQKTTEIFFKGNFRKVFGEQANYLDVDGNWILVGKG